MTTKRPDLAARKQSSGAGCEAPAVVSEYEAWEASNRLTAHDRAVLVDQLISARDLPCISIVMPVYNPPIEFLARAVETVREQIYQNWELCIADDCSSDPVVKPWLEVCAAADPRVRVVYREQNGHISRATNSAAELATGDFLAFFDQDDELTPDALAEVALYVHRYPETDLLYTDDGKIDAHGRCSEPQFKPDWSPPLLLSFMYMGHLLCVRRSLFERLGGFRPSFEGSQDYDFALRASELSRHVGHIPRILYHWRLLPGSTAIGGGQKEYSYRAGVNAVADTLRRVGIEGKVYHPNWARADGKGIYAVEFPDKEVSVAIVFPVSMHDPDRLRQCLSSLGTTEYANARIYVVGRSNSIGELPPPTGLFSVHRLAFDAHHAASEAELCNRAAAAVSEDVLVFLGMDIEANEAAWLRQMVGYLSLPQVGSVGARLLRPTGSLWQAGLIYPGPDRLPAAAYQDCPNEWGHQAATVSIRAWAALSAKALAITRKRFLDAGGFDAAAFPVHYYDFDLGVRLGRAGYYNILCPEATFTVHAVGPYGEGASLQERVTALHRYRDWRDPFLNPNFTERRSDLCFSSRRVVLHSTPRLRVAMVTHGLGQEGAPRSLVELAIGLKRAGAAEPVVVSHSDGPLRHDLERWGVPVDVIGTKDGRPLPLASGADDLDRYVAANLAFLDHQDREALSRSIDGLAERLRAHAPQVVLGNTILAFWAIEAAHRLGLPSLWAIRESELPFTHFARCPAALRDLSREALAYPYRVVFVAEATRALFSPFDIRRNMMVVPNGLDVEGLAARGASLDRISARRRLGLEDNDLSVLILGTVFERKGQLDLAQAMAALDEATVSRVRCDIVGDRPSEYSRRLHEEVARLPEHRRQRVRILAESQEAGVHLRAADIFVCCSRIESYPRVILEAMWCGLPIVTTPAFGIREQLSDRESCLFYEPGDIATLSRHLARLSANAPLREALGRNARLAFDLLTTHDEMISRYGRLLSEAWLSGGAP